MRQRSPRQKEGWATLLGKGKKGKRSQETSDEGQTTEDPTDNEDERPDEGQAGDEDGERSGEEPDAEAQGEDATVRIITSGTTTVVVIGDTAGHSAGMSSTFNYLDAVAALVEHRIPVRKVMSLKRGCVRE